MRDAAATYLIVLLFFISKGQDDSCSARRNKRRGNGQTIDAIQNNRELDCAPGNDHLSSSALMILEYLEPENEWSRKIGYIQKRLGYGLRLHFSLQHDADC